MTPHPGDERYQQPVIVYFKRGCDIYQASVCAHQNMRLKQLPAFTTAYVR